MVREADKNGYLLHPWGIETGIVAEGRESVAFLESLVRCEPRLGLRLQWLRGKSNWSYCPSISAPVRVMVFRQDSRQGKERAEWVAGELFEFHRNAIQWETGLHKSYSTFDDIPSEAEAPRKVESVRSVLTRTGLIDKITPSRDEIDRNSR